MIAGGQLYACLWDPRLQPREAAVRFSGTAARGSCDLFWYSRERRCDLGQDCSCERQLCVRVFSGAAARGAVIFSKITAARGSCTIVFQLSSGRVDGAVLCFTNIYLHFISFILPSCERCSCVLSITRPRRGSPPPQREYPLTFYVLRYSCEMLLCVFEYHPAESRELSSASHIYFCLTSSITRPRRGSPPLPRKYPLTFYVLWYSCKKPL